MAEGVAGKAIYQLAGDLTQLHKDLATAKSDVQKAGTDAEAQMKSGLGKFTSMSAQSKAMVVGVGAVLGTVGGLALQMGQDYAQATNTLITKTGASGQELKNLQQTMGDVAGKVPDDMNTVAQAVGGLYDKLDLTGSELDSATTSLLEFARLNNLQVPDAVDQATAALQRLGLNATDLPGLLDKLQYAEQQTGTSATDLMTGLSKVGPQLQSMGYDVDGSIALLAQWTQAGGDTNQLALGLNKAFIAFSKEGAPDAKTAMQDLVDQIKGAPDLMTAAGDAAKIFGTKVGTNMATMIRNGKLDVQALTDEIGTNFTGTVDNTTERTKTWGDRFQEFFNGIAAQVGPLTGSIGQIGFAFEGLTRILGPLGGLIGGLGGLLISQFKTLPAEVAGEAATAGAEIGTTTGEAQAAAQVEAATGTGAVEEMTAGIAAEGAPLAVEGATVGDTVGTATGTAMGTATVFAWAAALVAASVVWYTALNSVLGDATKQAAIAQYSGQLIAQAQSAGYSQEMQDKGQPIIEAAMAQAWAQGLPGDQIRQSADDAAKTFFDGLNGHGQLTDGMVDAYSVAFEGAMSSGKTLAEAQAAGQAAMQTTIDAATSTATADGGAAGDALLGALQDRNIGQEWATWIITNTNAQLDAKGQLQLDPLSQQLVDWASQVGTLTGDGVDKSIAEAMASGGKPVSDAIYAMMNGIPFDATVNGPLAALYEKLNVPQQMAVQWSTTGQFDLQKALDYALKDAGDVANQSLTASIVQSGFDHGLITEDVANQWYADAATAASAAGTTAGKTADTSLAKALIGNADQVQQAADQLHQDLIKGLAGKQDEATAVAKQTIQDFQKGIKAQDAQTQKDAEQVGLDALGALTQVMESGKGSTKDAKSLGVYFDGLVHSGMTAQQVLDDLKAGGTTVNQSIIDGLEKLYPADFTAGTTAATKVSAGFQGPDWEAQGETVGSEWTKGIGISISGFDIGGKLRVLEEHLKGQSPPKKGPLHDIDKWGESVGRAWAGGLVKGANIAGVLGSITPGVAAMGSAGLSGSMLVSVGGISVTVNGAVDPQGTADAVTAKVRAALDDVLAKAHDSAGQRWTAGQATA